MRKSIFLLTLVLWVSSLAGCNLQSKTTDNKTKTTVNSTENKTTNTASSNLDTTNITLYVDKNCEKAGIQQCNPKLWEAQFGRILGSGNKLNIVYINETIADSLKKIVPTTPVLSIPKDKVALFWQAARQITASGKLSNWVYYVPLYGWIAWEENLCNDGKDNNGNGLIDAKDPSCYEMTVLTSSKCKKQYCSPQLYKTMFMGYHVNIVDYDTPQGKKLYNELVKKNGGQTLPTFLINKKHAYLNQMQQFVKEVNLSWEKYQINIPQFKYDPSIEACSTNCNASPACKKLLSCNKTDKPTVDLFVMAHCPFGTQAEKWILGVAKLLKWKINFSVKFVDYDMHGKSSLDEDTLQHCIQKVEPQKYYKYLTCYLAAGNTDKCEKEAKLDMAKENACIKATDKKYNVTKDFNDKSTWVSWRFPKYEVNEDLNKKYNVQGSPTLVINWIKVQPQNRSPQAYLNIICSAFKTKPAECNKQVSNKPYDPMWGWTQSWKPAPAWSCGK